MKTDFPIGYSKTIKLADGETDMFPRHVSECVLPKTPFVFSGFSLEALKLFLVFVHKARDDKRVALFD